MASRVEIDENTETKGSMWVLAQKLDQPMDEEAGRLRNNYREKFSAILLLRLAFQSLGVVYGDLGTSPLYVFNNTFPHGIDDSEDVIGALSLIIYSLTLIPLLKYVFVVCRANDNGQGGTFALYSLLCRHAKVNTIPNQHRTDEELTTYSRNTFHEHSFAAKTKRWLEAHAMRKNALLILVLVGTCMVIGDGIFTPAISVLAASGGIKVDHPNMSTDVVIIVAVVILVGLFSMQHYGPDKVGWLFAPIVLLWFLLIGGIGIFNIWKYDSKVLRAFSPVYIYRYFRRRGKEGWISLGGIMLSITGTEALFADLAHFPVPAVQLAFTVVVFPCLLLAYSGQAAYLMKNKEHVIDAFYRSIPAFAGPRSHLVLSDLPRPYRSHLVFFFNLFELLVFIGGLRTRQSKIPHLSFNCCHRCLGCCQLGRGACSFHPSRFFSADPSINLQIAAKIDPKKKYCYWESLKKEKKRGNSIAAQPKHFTWVFFFPSSASKASTIIRRLSNLLKQPHTF